MDDRDPIAQALKDLREKESAAERIELKVPEGMEVILVDSVSMPKWPPAGGLNDRVIFENILDIHSVDFPREIDHPIGSMQTLMPSEGEVDCRYALLKVSQPLGVDVVRERAESFGTPVNIAGLVAIAGKMGPNILGPERMLLGLGTVSRDGFFPEISAEVVISMQQKRNTLYIGHYHKFFEDMDPDDEKVKPAYLIPVIIPREATILPS